MVDLSFDYCQLRICVDDIPKTTFKIRYDYYEFLVMPFELTNAATIFMELRDRMFSPYLASLVIVFIDDILRRTCATLRIVLQTLKKRLYANFSSVRSSLVL